MVGPSSIKEGYIFQEKETSLSKKKCIYGIFNIYHSIRLTKNIKQKVCN